MVFNKHKKPPVTAKSQGAQIRSGTKNYTTLRYLFEGNSLNCFEAYGRGDTCLHSTISKLCSNYNLDILRKLETVPNRFGGKTSVMRYWTSDEDNEKIGTLLGANHA